ncbi:MAG: mechanosensitive ion channel [Sphingomonadales bacterium]|nr:mechanosensitive ion channel [Sphingomonadales bacterium]PIX66106.1 MAG: MscS mechanosensitive ion channel [Sphingomonadales bacterium CG_4_10_14_3_um_filter_58_15]NCO49348.1 mechanosensitive ion channel [Sphingomonadales bacterium]NCO99520.1 mechanosensitive ion channel [Sphingomonadales bacterium]NCP27770.1 mechanosensitive ion channel [Sphingomonadales bacterium]
MSLNRGLLTLICLAIGLGPAAVGLSLPAVAYGQVAAEETADNPEPVIDPAASSADDIAIADRLRGIFREINGLETVVVNVDAGVVRLTGPIADSETADRAKAIAQRVSGVVTVDTQFERDLSVGSNVEPVVDKFGASLQNFLSALPLIGIAFLVAIAVGLLGHFLASLMGFWRRVMPNIFLAELIAGSIRVVFIMIGIFIGLDILNATALLGAVLGGAGVIGLAVGFALRDTVDNYMSSIMLSIRQPFRANDHVLIGEREGRVVRLTSRATILMTLNGNHLRIPNATVFKAEILNYSRNPQRRFSFELGVDADDDPAAAIETGLLAINGQDFVLNDPEATAEIKEVGDSNIVIAFHGWIDQRNSDFKKARGAAIGVTKNALEECGFALPEPIYRLRFDNGAQPIIRDITKEQTTATVSGKPQKATAKEAVDVSPEDHVEKLVDSERSDSGSSDLLDDQQPVE